MKTIDWKRAALGLSALAALSGCAWAAPAGNAKAAAAAPVAAVENAGKPPFDKATKSGTVEMKDNLSRQVITPKKEEDNK